MQRKLILFFLLFCCLAFLSFSQPFPNLSFISISEKNGLSSNTVSMFSQDEDGIIWAATSNGLNRYDGKNIKNYYRRRDSTSIRDNYITGIHCMPGNRIWLTSKDQISIFDSKTESLLPETKFLQHIDFVSPKLFQHKKNNLVFDFYHVWKILPGGQLKKYLDPFKPFSMAGKYYYSYAGLVTDRKQQLWGFCRNRIFKIDSSTMQPSNTWVHSKPLEITDIFFDSRGRCWVSTWGYGTYFFFEETGSFERADFSGENSIGFKITEWSLNNKDYVLGLFDPANTLIITDHKTLSSRQYKIDGKPLHLSSAFIDRENNLWLSATGNGIVLALSSNNPEVIPIIPPGYDTFNKDWAKGIYSYKQTASANWISGRYNGGTYIFDRNWKLKKYFSYLIPPQKDKYGITSNSEAYDFFPLGDKMYISTQSGLVIMDTSTYSTRLIYPDNDSVPPLLRTIVPENEHQWWIRSYNKGLYSFNPDSNKFMGLTRVYSSRGSPLDVNYILKTTKGRRLFAATFEGLYEYDYHNKKFNRKNTTVAHSQSFFGMAEDKNGLIWIGSDEGLIAYSPETDKVTENFSDFTEMGVCNRVCVDSFNNVWFNNQKGYWCWVQSRRQMVKFNYELGLPDNRTEAGFTFQPDGYVYGGGKNALVKFDPASVIKQNIICKTVFTDFYGNQQRFAIKQLSDSSASLSLPPGKYDVTINFAVPYFNAGGFELFYRIDPGSKDWLSATNGTVNLSSLQNGNYTFEFRGTNNITGNTTTPYYFQLTIEPEWYETWWLKIFLLLAVSAIVAYFVKRRIQNIRHQAGLKQKIAETEMQALRAQMNPHFIFNSLNSIENFILQNEKRLASDYLNKFSKLIRSILESSRNELVPFSKDMETLRWYIELEQLRFQNKFDVEYNIAPDLYTEDISVPPLIVQPYVENAIVHGIAHSTEIKNRLIIDVTTDSDSVIYRITDNGIGRKKSAELNKYNKPSHKSVGMQITNDRIRLHNGPTIPGDISIADMEPSGTSVTIKIKIN